jgi:hypothetical protein
MKGLWTSGGTIHPDGIGNAEIVFEPHENRAIQATGVEDNLFIFPDQWVGQHFKLVVERKGWDGPDDASR